VFTVSATWHLSSQEITRNRRVSETRLSRSHGPWRTMRPADWPRRGRRDHEEGIPELETTSGGVALGAGVANSGVGGRGNAAWADSEIPLRTRRSTRPVQMVS